MSILLNNMNMFLNGMSNNILNDMNNNILNDMNNKILNDIKKDYNNLNNELFNELFSISFMECEEEIIPALFAFYSLISLDGEYLKK